MKDKIIQLYNQGYSTRQIEKFCTLKRSRINTILKEAGVNMKSRGNPYKLRKYTLNQEFFNNIDTEEKAYWLGFIVADGHIRDDGIDIGLKREDRLHLKKFLEAVQSNTKITNRDSTMSSHISIYSIEMVAVLREMGLSRIKSVDAVFPAVKAELRRHLIRGIIDGDGSISITKNVYKTGINPTFSLSICGTEDIVQNIAYEVFRNTGAKVGKIQHPQNSYSIKSWGGNKQVLHILDWIYGDCSIYLDRKYKRYLNLKNLLK